MFLAQSELSPVVDLLSKIGGLSGTAILALATYGMMKGWIVAGWAYKKVEERAEAAEARERELLNRLARSLDVADRAIEKLPTAADGRSK